MDKDEIIKEILEENVKLKEELQATKEHLKKYTAPSNKKLYYEQNKDEIKQKVKEYKEKSNFEIFNSYFCANLNVQRCICDT